MRLFSVRSSRKSFGCSLCTLRDPFSKRTKIEGSLGTRACRHSTISKAKRELVVAEVWALFSHVSRVHCITSARGDGTRAARDSLAGPAATARSRRRCRVLRRAGLGVCVAGGIPPGAPRDDEEPDRAGEPTEEDLQPRLDGAAAPLRPLTRRVGTVELHPAGCVHLG